MYRYTFLVAMKYILSGCQNTQTSLQPFVTLSLFVKRNLHFFERVLPDMGFALFIVHLADRSSSILSYPELNRIGIVSQILYTLILVNFQDFRIFDYKQYFQGPKSKLLELLETLKLCIQDNVFDSSCWKIAGLSPAIFSRTP